MAGSSPASDPRAAASAGPHHVIDVRGAPEGGPKSELTSRRAREATRPPDSPSQKSPMEKFGAPTSSQRYRSRLKP